MYHQPWLGFVWLNFPQLLNANGVALRIFARIKLILGNQLFTQMPACALGKNGVFGVQFHTQLKTVAWFALFVQAQMTGGDALDRTLVVIQDLCCGKAWKNFYT